LLVLQITREKLESRRGWQVKVLATGSLRVKANELLQTPGITKKQAIEKTLTERYYPLVRAVQVTSYLWGYRQARAEA
jgi:hypothetical protein